MKNLKSTFIILVSVLFFANLSYGQRFQKPTFGMNAGISNPAFLPDLIVTNIKVPNLARYNLSYSGRTIKIPIDVTIKNVGRKDITNRQRFDVFLGAGNGSLFSLNRRTIKVGQSVKHRMYIKISDYYNNKTIKFFAVADRDRTTDDVYTTSIREINERNNTRSIWLKIPRFRKQVLSR